MMKHKNVVYFVLVCLGLMSTLSCAATLLEWKFDGNTNDSSGNGNNGTITEGTPGSVSLVTEGRILGSIEFTNTKDRVVSPNVNLAGAFTVAGWIKVADGFSGSWNRFLCTDDHKTGFFIGQDAASGKWKFAVNNGWGLPLGGTITPGQWQHVAGTYSGTHGRLYIDGVLVSGPSAMPVPSNPNQPIVLGKDKLKRNNGFPGQFEDIRIYKRALNAAEIQSLNSSQIDHCLNPSGYDLNGDCQVSFSDLILLSENWLDDLPGIAESHLLGDWPLDTNAKDSSGNSNNGTPLPAQVGSISFTSDGQNGSIRFANSKDRVVFSTIDIGSAFTVAGWIKVADGFSGSWNRFLCTDDHKTGFFIGQDADSGKWKFAVNDGWALPLAGSILPGQWQHVAATYDGSSGRLYIDGQFVAGPSAMPVPSDPQQQFVLGRDKKTYNKGFPGSFDEIKLYSRALTDAEIKSLYNMKTKSCVASSDYDLNGDCKISFPDLVLLAAEWLECGRLESCE
jgi:hypothetical protein